MHSSIRHGVSLLGSPPKSRQCYTTSKNIQSVGSPFIAKVTYGILVTEIKNTMVHEQCFSSHCLAYSPYYQQPANDLVKDSYLLRCNVVSLSNLRVILVIAIHTLYFITVTVKRCTWSISILKICYLVFSYLNCRYSLLLRMQIHYCKDSNTTKTPPHRSYFCFY